jgi:hypothetical protein
VTRALAPPREQDKKRIQLNVTRALAHPTGGDVAHAQRKRQVCNEAVVTQPQQRDERR